MTTEYEKGFEYGAHPARHVHEDGCGHSGEGIDPDFLRGWRAGRRFSAEIDAIALTMYDGVVHSG